MNRLLLIVLLLLGFNCFAQKVAWKKLGGAEKFWVLTHPFVAKKTFYISQQVLQTMDSLKKVHYFTGNTLSGSKADAVRHAYWMAELTNQIGVRKALWLGNAHEKKNRKDFKRGLLEESFSPDEAAMNMDLLNNKVGSIIGKRTKDSKLLAQVLEALRKGKLFYIKQNNEGDFLDKNNQIIPIKQWSGLWQNDRIIVPTN